MNFRVLIGGVNLSSIALIEGLEIVHNSDEAISTARVQFMQRLAPGGKFTEVAAIKEWAHIQIVDDSPGAFPRFGGYIAEITRDAQDNEKYRADCRCVNYGTLFERKISTQVFADETDQNIAIALSLEGGIPAPVVNVDFTNILAEFDARDLTVREALERLCEITGCRWYVDPSMTFRYHKHGTHFTPFNLSDTPDYTLSFPYRMLQCNRGFSSAANRMLFLGGPGADGGELRVTREDTSSQAQYGVLEAVHVDRAVAAASVAQLMLDSELAQRAFPNVSGRVLVRDSNLWGEFVPGLMIGVKSALYGIDDNYQIYGIRYYLDRAVQEAPGILKPAVACEMEFGRRESDLVSMMRILARKDAALPEAVIGPDTVIPAENIEGVIDAEHIGGVAAENIEGTIEADQIGTVAADSIVGVIGGPGSSASVSGQSITGVIGGPGSDVDITAANITGVIVGAQLTDQILDTLRLVGPGMGVVERIPSAVALPGLPNLEYPVGSTVLQAFVLGVSKLGTGRLGSTLYENVANTWAVTSASATLTGIIKAPDIESIHAKQITGVIVSSQIEEINADQITGMIQGDQIENVTADSIISVNAEAITGPISAENITSLNAADITMIVAWDKDQIGSVKASSITAGTISATVQMTSPDIRVSGTGYNLILNNLVGLQITATGTTRTMTVTDARVRIETTAGTYSLIDEAGIEAAHPGGATVRTVASATLARLSAFVGARAIIADATSADASIIVQGALGNTVIGGAFITTTQMRLANTGAVTVVSNPSKSITVYDTAGAVLGKVPVF